MAIFESAAQVTRRSLLLGATALPALASEPRSLFDGASTTGWRAAGGDRFPAQCWSVDNGCLHALASNEGQDIRTVAEFEDFDLEFEWKIGPGANSGVKYLLFREDRKRSRARGFEFQIADDENEPDAAAHPESRSGGLYGFVAPSKVATLPVGQFNTARIVRRGPSIEHWMNGARVVAVRLDTDRLRDRMLARKVPLDLPVRSPVALQNHTGEAWFRNLRIRA